MAMTFGPLLEVARIQSEINRLFDNLLDLGTPTREGGAWIPNIDISETGDNLFVKIELPGVPPGELALSSHGGDVIVEGTKPVDEHEGTAEQRVAERVFGRFRRVIHLNVPVNTRQAEARFADGLLEVRFPKVPNRRGEQVAIEVKTP